MSGDTMETDELKWKKTKQLSRPYGATWLPYTVSSIQNLKWLFICLLFVFI